MERPDRVVTHGSAGHTLLELMLVLFLLGICLAVGGVSLGRGLRALEARGAAQAWQAAATWAQIGAVWTDDAVNLGFDHGRLELRDDAGTGIDGLGESLPAVEVVPNVLRWSQGGGVWVRFLAGSGSPSGAGSLYFTAPGTDYRVTVRLESGLTVRTRAEAVQ